MKILITSGGTTEKIDAVRGITNHSTGYLGKEIAELFLSKGHQVTLVTTKTAVKPEPKENLKITEITNVESLLKKMEPLVKEHDVLIHSMAVSDYTPIYMTDFAELTPKISLNSCINLTLKARYHRLLIIRFFFLKKHRRSLASSNNGILIFN